MHPLQAHISSHTQIVDEDFEKLLSYFKPVLCAKKQFLIRPGQSIGHQYFVEKGCLRTFMIDHQGKEHTIQFAVENWWVSDYISYYSEVSSLLFVECVEDCELLKVSKEDLRKLFDELPILERFFRKQLENAFVAFQLRILSNLYKTSEERYTLFVKDYPNIEQRVKNYHIASYLGITPESLSRLRKRRE